jgi:hypothetical protein
MPVARAGWSWPAETSDERARRTKPIASRSFVLDFGTSQPASRSSRLETARVSLSIVVVLSTTLYILTTFCTYSSHRCIRNIQSFATAPDPGRVSPAVCTRALECEKDGEMGNGDGGMRKPGRDVAMPRAGASRSHCPHSPHARGLFVGSSGTWDKAYLVRESKYSPPYKNSH